MGKDKTAAELIYEYEEKQKLIKQVVAQFARDMGEPYHNEEAIEDVLWECLNEGVFRTYLRHQSEEYVEPTRDYSECISEGITRPIAERGTPMPDQSHLYIDCTEVEEYDYHEEINSDK